MHIQLLLGKYIKDANQAYLGCLISKPGVVRYCAMSPA